MKRSRRIKMAARVTLASMLITATAVYAGDTPTGRTVAEQYPFLVSGVLTHARAATLPDGIIARTGELTVTAEALDQAIEEAPYFARAGLQQDPIPVLEQYLAERLLVALARAEAKGKDGQDTPDEQTLVRHYTDRVTGAVNVPETDLRAFYDANRDACGRLPFEQVKSYIEQLLSERLRRETIERFFRSYGYEHRIEVSTVWLDAHAATALDNPVDRLRGKGKPILAVFSTAGCCGPDRMEPILQEAWRTLGDETEVVYIDARRNQALAIRHRISGVPTSLVFASDGMESIRHQGLVEMPTILGWFGALGL